MTSPLRIASDAELERFVEDYISHMVEGNAAVFAGAGLSVPAGFVDWPGLMQPIAEGLGLDIKEEHDLIAVAQFQYNNAGSNRSELTRVIVKRIGVDAVPTPSHQILASLPIDTYWTTNYDRLIERALSDAGKLPDVKIDGPDFATTLPGREAVVYKMHGDISRPAKAVVTKDDYARYSAEREPFITAFLGDLVKKTFLFLGVGFNDPNIDFVLSRVRASFKEDQRQHYCLTKLRTQKPDESTDVAARAAIRQALAVADLKRYNIQTLVVDEYSAITDVLRRIERRYRRRSILVSGSAATFAPWEEESANIFLRNLGRILVERGFRIITGMGVGVSNPLITGAITAVYDQKRGHVDESIVMRPFPQWEGGTDKSALWDEYRRDLVSMAGIALFVFGNKLQDDSIVIAEGVTREFELAHESGLALVPVGATGYAAEALWSKMNSDTGAFLPHAIPEQVRKFGLLGSKVTNPIELLQPLLDYLDLLAKE